jgi:hypothetical protein
MTSNQHSPTSEDNNNDTTGTSLIDPSSDPNTTDDPIIPILAQITSEYQQLSKEQRQVEEWIQRLQMEEKALLLALEQATVVPQKAQHQQALERLERALFQEDSDDDDDSSDNSDDDG